MANVGGQRGLGMGRGENLAGKAEGPHTTQCGSSEAAWRSHTLPLPPTLDVGWPPVGSLCELLCAGRCPGMLGCSGSPPRAGVAGGSLLRT